METKKKTNNKAAVTKSVGKKSMKKKAAAKKTAASSNSTAASAKPRTKAVRKAKKKSSLIGIDPLAWIHEAPTTATQQDADAGKNSQSTNTLTMNFSPRFNIREVAAVYTELQQLLDKAVNVELDFEDVDVVDTAAIQLLVAFTREARKRGASISWQQPSAALYRSAELLGLSQELGLPDNNI